MESRGGGEASRQGEGVSGFRGEAQGRGGSEGEREGRIVGGWGGDVGSVRTGHEAQGAWPIIFSFVFC